MRGFWRDEAQVSRISRNSMTKLTCAPLLLAAIFLPQMVTAYTFLDPSCTIDDPTKCAYVFIYGKIGASDLETFQKLDEALPDGSPFPVVELNSNGGYVNEGMAIGRILRRHKARVETGSPLFPHRSARCSSSCFLIAAGASERILTHMGVHNTSQRVRTGANIYETQGVRWISPFASSPHRVKTCGGRERLSWLKVE